MTVWLQVTQPCHEAELADGHGLCQGLLSFWVDHVAICQWLYVHFLYWKVKHLPHVPPASSVLGLGHFLQTVLLTVTFGCLKLNLLGNTRCLYSSKNDSTKLQGLLSSVQLHCIQLWSRTCSINFYQAVRWVFYLVNCLFNVTKTVM